MLFAGAAVLTSQSSEKVSQNNQNIVNFPYDQKLSASPQTSVMG